MFRLITIIGILSCFVFTDAMASENTEAVLNEFETLLSKNIPDNQETLKASASDQQNIIKKEFNWEISLGGSFSQSEKSYDSVNVKYENKGYIFGLARKFSKLLQVNANVYSNQLATEDNLSKTLAVSLGAGYTPFRLPISSEYSLAPTLLVGGMNRPYIYLNSADIISNSYQIQRENLAYIGLSLSLSFSNQVALIGQGLYLSDKNTIYSLNLGFGI